MDRRRAEKLYDSGKEPTVRKFLEYDAENKRLKRRNAQLERNSMNSSKPPSSDNPQDKNPQRKPESGSNPRRRNPGGQPGHKGSKRELIPVEVLKSNFGPRLASIIAYMTAVLHVSRRGTREFCEILLNARIALGSIQNLLGDTCDALERTDKELKDALPEQQVINADETGWRNRWLWIFVASTFIYFQVAKSRGSKVLAELFGKFYRVILCVDRWGAHTKYHKGLFQICWSHLKRDFLGVLKMGQAVESGDAIWYRFKEGDMFRSEPIQKTKSVRNAMKRCLKDYMQSEERCVRTLAGKLLKRFDHLFTFIFYEGIEPTNNIAERGIRPAVQWRKICFGNRSDNGAGLTSRLLTVTRTCWPQKRNPLEFLVDAITAHRSGMAAPCLL